MNEQERIAFDNYMQNVENELQRFNEMVEGIKHNSQQELAQHIQLNGTYKTYNDYVISLMRKNRGKNDELEIPLSEQEWLQLYNK